MSGNPGVTLARLGEVDREIILRSKQFSLALTARAYERPVTAHTPALLLQGIFVNLPVFHNHLEVVLVIHHHVDTPKALCFINCPAFLISIIFFAIF